MEWTFTNRAGDTFPHTAESREETVEVARLHGFDAPEGFGTLADRSVPNEETHALAEALERAVREDLGDHSVLADFAAVLRGGGVVVEDG